MSLRGDGVEEDTTTIATLGGHATDDGSFTWTPTSGVYAVTINATVLGVI